MTTPTLTATDIRAIEAMLDAYPDRTFTVSGLALPLREHCGLPATYVWAVTDALAHREIRGWRLDGDVITNTENVGKQHSQEGGA